MIPSSSLSIAAKSSWLKGSDINIQSDLHFAFLDSPCFPLFSWWGFEVRRELIECLACTVFASATASWFKEVMQSGCKLTKEKLTTSSNGGHIYFLSLFSRKHYRLQFPKQRQRNWNSKSKNTDEVLFLICYPYKSPGNAGTSCSIIALSVLEPPVSFILSVLFIIPIYRILPELSPVQPDAIVPS